MLSVEREVVALRTNGRALLGYSAAKFVAVAALPERSANILKKLGRSAVHSLEACGRFS